MKGSQITKFDYYLRLSVIIFAALSPFICLLSFGYLKSLSQYWESPLQPIFVISNAITSYYLITLDNWRPSAILLILLTAFSVEYYQDLHNIMAVAFFIVTAIPLKKANNFKFCFVIYLLSVLILPFSLFFAEVVAILAMCIYHTLSLHRLYNLSKQRVMIKDSIN